jgi:hypothetical protein
MSAGILSVRPELVAAKLTKHPNAIPPNGPLVGEAYFAMSERFFAQLENPIAPAANLTLTQASLFETRIWCLLHLEDLMSIARQAREPSTQCLDAIGDCIIFEYLHGDVTADTVRTSTQTLGNRIEEYDRRWRNINSGGNPFGWFWSCLLSAQSGKPRTADSAIVLESALQSFSHQMEIIEATKKFRAAVQPLFDDTRDFTAVPPSDFERKTKRVTGIP